MRISGERGFGTHSEYVRELIRKDQERTQLQMRCWLAPNLLLPPLRTRPTSIRYASAYISKLTITADPQADHPTRACDLSLQRRRMKRHMIANEAGDEVIAMIMPGLPAQGQWVVGVVAGGLQQVGAQLHVQEFIRQTLVHQ